MTIRAGRKWGKSSFCCYLAWRFALTVPNPEIYIIGPTNKQQREIMWNNGKIQNFGPKEYQDKKPHSTEGRVWVNGGFIKVDGSDNYESYRGTQYHLMILDEMKDQDPRFYEAAYPNLRSLDGTLICIGTPPDHPDNFYVKLLNDTRSDPDWSNIHGTSWENPYINNEYNPRAAHAWLAREKKKYYERGDRERWEREYEANLVFGGKSRVLPNVSRQKHVKPKQHIDELLKLHGGSLEWYCLLDPGTTTCFAGLLIAYQPYTSQVFLLEEIYEKDQFRTSVDYIWPQVRQKMEVYKEKHRVSFDKWKIFYDDAAAWFGNEVSSRYETYCQPAGKFAQDKELGISIIKDLARQENGLFISTRCDNFMWEVENYVRGDDGRIPKKNDHLIDCLRYFFVVSYFELNEKPAPFVDDEKMVRHKSLEEDLQIWAQEDDVAHGFEDDDAFIFGDDEWMT